jgi:ABC-type multidrug transport system ATPase subunit
MDDFINLLLNDSVIEYILTKSLLNNNMNEHDKQTIQFFIESDKKINFINIKTQFMLMFLIEVGYFTDNVENKYLLKILTTSFVLSLRPYLSKQCRKNEKKSLINIAKCTFEKFNNNVDNEILKNININNNDEINVIKSIYLESYNNILTAYQHYTLTINSLLQNISNIIIYLFIYPLVYKLKYGILRNIFNSMFSVFYNVCVLKLFEDGKNNDKIEENKNEYSTNKLINTIISLFDNINIIVENDTLSNELKNIVKEFQNIITKSDFLSKYTIPKFSKDYVSTMKKYKIVDTITSMIINDQNMLLYLEINKTNIVRFLEIKMNFYMKVKTTRIIFDIISKKPYNIPESIQWNSSENIKYIFTLNDTVLDYKNDEGSFDTIIKIKNIKFEIGKVHFLYGNSGCGKTTLINALMKKIDIKIGSIKFLDIYENYSYFNIRKYLTYISCENAIFYNNLYFNLVYGIPKEKLLENKNEIKNEIIKYMTMFGLKKFIPIIKKKNALNLSKGQKQRIVIVRLMIHIIFNDLKILFLDEFTSNIDNQMEEIIYTELIKLQRIYNFTVFFVSHNLYNMKYSDFNYHFNFNDHNIVKNKTVLN